MFHRSNKYRRRSIRRKGYDYSRPGSYFVTLNCANRFPLFGEIHDGEMILNDFGKIAHSEWIRTSAVRPNVEIGPFIIMPDHLHGIIMIKYKSNHSYTDPERFNACRTQDVGLNRSEEKNEIFPVFTNLSLISPSQTLGAIIRGYMGTVTRQINALRETPQDRVWQRNYYDRIIRTKEEFRIISRYIVLNPKNWERHND